MARHGTSERDVVAGIFREQETAARALAELIEQHFDPTEDISVVLKDEWNIDRQGVTVRDETELLDGAKIGGGIGAVLGATGAGLVGAGLLGGPLGLVAAGPLVAALQGALAGGAFGTFSGWLVGAGLLKEEADLAAADLEKGAVWIGVHARGERAQLARKVLQEAGAEHLAGP